MGLWIHKSINNPTDLYNHWDINQIPAINSKVNYTSHWSGTDTQENWASNPKPGYSETSITYNYNSYGYRTKEFDLSNSRPSILCLGCSFTEGVGVNYEETWVSKLEQHFTDYHVYNLGVNGGSGDSVSRILYNIGNVLDTKIVFILWPHLFRQEIYLHKTINNSVASETNSHSSILTDINFFNKQEKNKAIINLLSQLHRYTVIDEDISLIYKDRCPIIDRGRDNHPGPQWHLDVAQHFIKLYDNSKIQLHTLRQNNN